MSATAAEQLRRILDLIPRLADGEEHDLEEVAAVTGLNPEALLADLDSLVQRFDAPGGFVEGVQIYLDDRSVSVFSSHFLRPMRLTMQELCALELGLAILRANRPPDEHPPIDRALERLRQVITKLPANERHEALRYAELSSPGNVAHLATLRRALRAHRKVRLCYRSGGAPEPTTRLVHPYTLLFSAGMWYVAAYCERSQEVRFFRLDRIETAELTDLPFTPSAVALEEVLANQRVFRSDSPEVMTVRYSPRIARWVAEREGKPLAPDGSLTLEHPLADVHWAMRHVLQYGPDAEVLAPESLRRAVAKRLEEMAAGDD